MLETVCAFSLLGVAGLAYKLWTYRLAIIQLQADMTLVLNELTRPSLKQSILCNLCETRMSPNDYAHHVCDRITSRAKAMNEAKAMGIPVYEPGHAYDTR